MNMKNLTTKPLHFDEFLIPASSMLQAKTWPKRFYLGFTYLIVIIDILGLQNAFTQDTYTAFDIVLLICQLLILIVLLPKSIGMEWGIKFLSIQHQKFILKKGIFSRKAIPINDLKEISIKEENGYAKLMLHYKDGKVEKPSFNMKLSFTEDRDKVEAWFKEANNIIENYQPSPIFVA